MESNKKKLLVAAVFAGALALPAAALAGVASGNCVNCHTMHNSQGGQVMVTGSTYGDAGNGTLLKKSGGCAGCHTTGVNAALTGMDATLGAPQVDNDPIVAGDLILAGGFFDPTTPADANIHNVVDLSHGIDAAINTNLGTSPGGAFATANGANPALTCQGCHGAKIHHGTAAGSNATYLGTSVNSYRGLGGVGAVYVSTRGAASGTYGVDDGSVTPYDAATMNSFCAGCHGDFHGTANTGTASPWTRHPTNIVLPAAYDTNYAAALVADTKVNAKVPVGGDGTNSDIVMCISCHRPHGSDQADLIRFGYNDGANNLAGGVAQSVGCESCHGAK